MIIATRRDHVRFAWQVRIAQVLVVNAIPSTDLLILATNLAQLVCLVLCGFFVRANLLFSSTSDILLTSLVHFFGLCIRMQAHILQRDCLHARRARPALHV